MSSDKELYWDLVVAIAKLIWHLSILVIITALLILGCVEIRKFNSTHDLYHGISALICIVIVTGFRGQRERKVGQ